MSDQELEMQLLERLRGSPKLIAKGYAVEVDGEGRVVIHRGGHFRGVWRSVLGVLEWTPAGYNGPLFKVADLDAAVWHTLVALGLESPKH